MSKVVAIMSMSLDGFVADLNDGVAEVFDWYVNSGDVEFHTGGSDPMTFKVSGPSAEHLRGLWSGLAAVLTGRRTFDVAHGWDVVGDLVRHIFSAEKRYVDRLSGRPLTDPTAIPTGNVEALFHFGQQSRIDLCEYIANPPPRTGMSHRSSRSSATWYG